jgi:Uma2 family endonuclease
MTLRPPFSPITTEFYEKLPEGPPYYELIEGNLIMSPSPNFYHQQILLRLSRWIGNYLEQNSIGILAVAPSDVVVDGINVLQPDLYFVSNSRRSVIVESGAKGAPDLAVEILSPSNALRDRNEKRSIYARAGVKEMWIVDPEAHVIEAHQLTQGLDSAPAIVREPAIFESGIFPGLQVDTARLFKPI